jgi:hypothetical protein
LQARMHPLHKLGNANTVANNQTYIKWHCQWSR